MFTIPSNYYLPFSKLKEYLDGWYYMTAERDIKDETGSKNIHQIVNGLNENEVIFSHTYGLSEKFGENTIVGTNQVCDKSLSMMINQLIGFDVMEGNFTVLDEMGEPMNASKRG